MEFSSYFYHSNRLPYCITFINNKKGLFQIIISIIHSEGYEVEEYNERRFIITYEELQNSKNLYKIYVLSLLLTENTTELHYTDNGTEIMGDVEWCLKTKKIWKGMYITNHYEKSYGFYTIPTEIIIENIELNNDLKEYYLGMFEKDGYSFVSCNSKTANNYLNNNIDDYINNSISYLEYALADIEKKVYNVKKYKMFIDKLSKYKNLEDVNMIILANICK